MTLTTEAAADLAAYTERLEAADTDTAFASTWSDIQDLASRELAKLDVQVERIPWDDEPEALGPIMIEGKPAGEDEDGRSRGWIANSEEVAAWCLQHGLDWRVALNSKRWPCIAVTFDGRPDETTRDGLKAAGFRWDKPKKAWAHGLFGDNANPDSKAQVMRREVAA